MDRVRARDQGQIFGGCSAHLRKVLGTMFPASYIELYHKSPNNVCSLLNTRCCTQSWTDDRVKPETNVDDNDCHHEVSTEPSSRASLMSLREHLNSSLVEHQARMVGLCPIRRSIYDQCFDELIRQVTVGCIEQGLLLFRVRNELRMTMKYYRRAYEAGVNFGLNKAIEAEVKLERSKNQVQQLKSAQDIFERNLHITGRINEVELRNKLESVDRMEDYYTGEIAKKDEIIQQQRAIIKALSQKGADDIRGPM